MSELVTTTSGVSSILQQETGEVFCYLLEIDYDPAEEHLYYTNNITNITSGSQEYESKHFDFILPSSNAERPPAARLTIEDSSTFLIGKFRDVEKPPVLKFTVVRADSPDSIEGSLSGMLLKNISTSDRGATIQADIIWDSFISEPYPIHKYDPSLFPGLFA